MATVVFLCIVAFIVLALVLWGIISAPVDSESRRLDDEAQIEFLKQLKKKGEL